MSKPRTTRYLPLRDKIAECKASLEAAYDLEHKVNKLVAIERLLMAKKTT